MSTLTRAIEVEVGEKITSRQYRSLARACNDRLRLWKDGAQRVAFLFHNLARQVRNSSADGWKFPSNGEWLEHWLTIDPEKYNERWAEMPPGEPEGVNLGSQLPQYVHGTPSVDAEDERINSVFQLDAEPTLEGVWQLGKDQRGLYDPRTGGQNWPAGEAALQWMSVTNFSWSPHGKSFGDYFASPLKILDDCGGSGAGVASWQIKFTSLRSGVSTTGLHGSVSTDPVTGIHTMTYAGTCPCGSDYIDNGHVLQVVRPLYDSGAYYVWVVTAYAACEGVYDVLLAADWMEGPYEGRGVLSRDDGLMIQRMMQRYVEGFRGTPEQRVEPYTIRELAPDFERLFTSQYFLSPNRGLQAGELLAPCYPRFEFAGKDNWSRGELGVKHGSKSTRYVYADGFVLGVAFAKGSGMIGSATVELRNGADVIGQLSLDPDDNGDASAIVTFPEAVRPNPLTVALSTGARFKANSGGNIWVECTEQVAMKPQFWDAALLCRTWSTHGSIAGDTTIDANGRSESEAKHITEDWFTYGCVKNSNGASGVKMIEETTNDHPIYEAVRRFAHGCVRGVTRHQFAGYEVGADGKSVLYLRRFSQGWSRTENGVVSGADSFADIAPPLEPMESGKLIEGEEYIVKATAGGNVTYKSVNYVEGERFTADTDKEFAADDDAKVFIYDGIKHAALKGGFTNQWVMFMESHAYNPGETSPYKPAAYADWLYFDDRCLRFQGVVPADLLQYVAMNYGVNVDASPPYRPVISQDPYVSASMLGPECVSALRYTGGAGNNGNCSPYVTEDFCSSCQVYEPLSEIESCTVHQWGEDQVVKLVFTGRFTHHADAPATISLTVPTWASSDARPAEIQDLYDESYRTTENALLEYRTHIANPHYQASLKTGDMGYGAIDPGIFGSCYPRFTFVHLIPEPYEDDNDVLDAHDSRCLVDGYAMLETYLHAQCEGWINNETSEAVVCELEEGSLFNFRFDELCLQAFGGRSCGAFSLEVRDDKPAGHGPLPCVRMYADCHNRLARSYNLLTRARVDLPLTFEWREDHYYSERDESGRTWAFYGDTECTAGGNWNALARITGYDPAYSHEVDWQGGTSFGASDGLYMLSQCPFTSYRIKQTAAFRVQVDTTFYFAVPDTLKTMLSAGQYGALARFDWSQASGRVRTLDCGDTGVFECGGAGGHKFKDPSGNCIGFGMSPGDDNYEAWSTCGLVTSGTISAPSVSGGDVGVGYDTPIYGAFCNGGGAQAGVAVTILSESGIFLEFTLADLP